MTLVTFGFHKVAFVHKIHKITNYVAQNILYVYCI